MLEMVWGVEVRTWLGTKVYYAGVVMEDEARTMVLAESEGEEAEIIRTAYVPNVALVQDGEIMNALDVDWPPK